MVITDAPTNKPRFPPMLLTGQVGGPYMDNVSDREVRRKARRDTEASTQTVQRLTDKQTDRQKLTRRTEQ